ncbi:hypothetical protein EVAR_13121_1 [Eumeta japonica]|uniref:Uncharacterized protein n=1 Tax=Eumeta variegata TaxID=151549 RepID=A0A4C1U9Q7_EUMVA|nr:hypothetical protein EVAR_13121_1 [Eumeta japonica]
MAFKDESPSKALWLLEAIAREKREPFGMIARHRPGRSSYAAREQYVIWEAATPELSIRGVFHELAGVIDRALPGRRAVSGFCSGVGGRPPRRRAGG